MFSRTAFIGFLLLLSPSVYACNCVTYSIKALHMVHLKLKTVPNIAVNDWFKHPGAYSRGVVNIKDINNCQVMLHEFIHHIQWEAYGDALDIHEWQRREMQAAQITMIAAGEMADCGV